MKNRKYRCLTTLSGIHVQVEFGEVTSSTILSKSWNLGVMTNTYMVSVDGEVKAVNGDSDQRTMWLTLILASANCRGHNVLICTFLKSIRRRSDARSTDQLQVK